MTCEVGSSSQTTSNPNSAGRDSCQSAQDIGASGDVDRAVDHIRCNPGDRDAVEKAMVESGHFSQVNQLAERLNEAGYLAPSELGLGTQGAADPQAPSPPSQGTLEALVSGSSFQWGGLSVSTMSVPGSNLNIQAVSLGGYSLTNMSSPDGTATTLAHTNADGEASTWSVGTNDKGVTLASQHADGSGVKHEYVAGGGSRHTHTEAPGWVTESSVVEVVRADGSRAVQDSTNYGVTILNAGGTSVTEFDAQGNEVASTSKGSLNAGIPYVVAGSLEAQVGSNWGAGAKVELGPLGEAARQVSDEKSEGRLAGANVGFQVGKDGGSVVLEGDLLYDKGLAVTGEVTALRDPMTNATTVEVGVGAKVATVKTGVSANAGTLTDVAGNEVGGYAEAAGSLLGFGLQGGARTTDEAGRQGYVGVTGPLGTEGGIKFGADGAALYGDFNDVMDSKPDLSEMPQ
jgi:hypothetical protein